MSVTNGTHLEVRPLAVGDAPMCDQIILSLPRHFGYETGREACAQAVRTSEGWVATLDGRVIGFLTVQPQNATTVEITWMAVHAERRGQGIGRRLIERLRQETQAQGYRLLLVSTLAPPMREILRVRSKRATLRRGLSIKRWAFWPSVKFLCTGEWAAIQPCCWSCLSKRASLYRCSRAPHYKAWSMR
jgi:GNAT superfamily N-acetyltransferase